MQARQEAEHLHQATKLPSSPHGMPLGIRWRAFGTRVLGDACGPLDAFHGPGDTHRPLAGGPTTAPMEAWHSVHPLTKEQATNTLVTVASPEAHGVYAPSPGALLARSLSRTH